MPVCPENLSALVRAGWRKLFRRYWHWQRRYAGTHQSFTSYWACTYCCRVNDTCCNFMSYKRIFFRSTVSWILSRKFCDSNCPVAAVFSRRVCQYFQAAHLYNSKTESLLSLYYSVVLSTVFVCFHVILILGFKSAISAWRISMAAFEKGR